MNDLHEVPHQNKISPAFSARLARLSAKQKLRAVIVIRTPVAAGRSAGRRTTREERQATIDEIRSSATPAIQEVDTILTRFGGQRLSEKPTALGTLTIETTPEGISALSQSEHVSAILEDQPVSRVF
jgi:hypothetical protein